MTTNQFKRIIRLLDELKEIPTWTSKKKQKLKTIMEILRSGKHEEIYANCRSHHFLIGVGQYYIENSDHLRRGTLMKYRGKKVLIMCTGGNSWSMCNYIIATIEAN